MLPYFFININWWNYMFYSPDLLVTFQSMVPLEASTIIKWYFAEGANVSGFLPYHMHTANFATFGCILLSRPYSCLHLVLLHVPRQSPWGRIVMSFGVLDLLSLHCHLSSAFLPNSWLFHFFNASPSPFRAQAILLRSIIIFHRW
jgi:hypothetical protein